MDLYIRIIVAICLIGSQVGAAPASDSYEELFEKVFGSGAKQLSVKQTLEHLETMVDLAPAVERVPIENLISASELAENDCNLKTLDAISLMLKSHSIYTVNVLPYLNHYRRRLFENCDDELAEELREASQNAFAEIEESMTQLKEDIIGGSQVANSPKTNEDLLVDLPNTSYAAGIVKFLERLLGPIDTHISRERFGFLAIRQMEPICGLVRMEFEPAVRNYDSLLDDEQIRAKLAPFVVEWINNVRICRNVFNEFSSIVSDCHSLISGHKVQ